MLALQMGEEAHYGGSAGTGEGSSARAPMLVEVGTNGARSPQSCCPGHLLKHSVPESHRGQLRAVYPTRVSVGCGALESPPRLGMPACLARVPSLPAWHSREEVCQEPAPAAKPARAFPRQEIII